MPVLTITHTLSILIKPHLNTQERTKLVAYIKDSPKPPPERITFTFPVMVHAKVCLFPVTGEGKAEIMKKVVEENADVPANLVAPQAGKLIWLIDEAAASQIKKDLRY